MPALATAVAALATHLGLREIVLVGHSFGGATVAQVAVDRPALLKGLVLLAASDPDGRRSTSPEEAERTMEAHLAARRARRWPGGAFGDDGGGAAAAFRRRLAAEMDAASERRLRGAMHSMLALRLGAAVGRLPMPVLVAGGDADWEIPLGRLLATWAKYAPGTGLHVWHGVGHSPNVEALGRVAALLRRFVEHTSPARRDPAGRSVQARPTRPYVQ